MKIAETVSRTAREYLRVSKGKGKSARSITDQHTDNVIAEEDHGPWTWGAAYVDTGSASRYATKVRDDFDRLTADLRTGAFGRPGDVLVLWEISRLSRETGRGVELIDLCEARGYLIHVTSEERTYNPQNYADRHALVTGIADAEKEARRLSARTLRGVNSASRKGAPHGVIPFGYGREYALVDGRSRPVSQHPVPDDARHVVELFLRVWRGEAINAVSGDWQARGIVSRRGTPFAPQNIRPMLINKSYIGIRVHNGRETPGAWPVIADFKGCEITPEEFVRIFWEVQAILADPSRRTHTGSGIKHWLSMTMRCNECGGPEVVTYRNAAKSLLPPAYQCRDKGCTRITKEGVDAAVSGEIVKYVQRLIRLGLLESGEGENPELTAVREALASARAELWELDAATPETVAEGRVFARMTEAKEREISGLEARQKQLTRPNRLADVFADADDAAAHWEALEVTVKREIAAILLTPGLLGEVRVMRAPAMGAHAGRIAAADRLKWHREA